MMSRLKALIPGAQHWPRFERNASEQYEGRLVQVRTADSPSLFFEGMAGSVVPIANAHGEGRAVFADEAEQGALVSAALRTTLTAMQQSVSLQPEWLARRQSPFTTADGRFTIVMPHPERVFRTVQMSWQPPGLGEDSPWIRIFQNARRWVG